MHTDFLYELKKKMLKELDNFSKNELTKESLNTIDILSHATKNICKIIEEMEEDEYGDMDDDYSRRDGFSYGRYSRADRRGDMSYRRRDRMGRFSRDDGMIAELRRIMETVPERSREDMQRLIYRMEQE